jgi:hypothetical protein
MTTAHAEFPWHARISIGLPGNLIPLLELGVDFVAAFRETNIIGVP